MSIKICAFDAYGTLLDVTAAARRAMADIDPQLGLSLANDWRLKQLQYTWIRAIAGEHADFWQVTRESLDWALERHGLAGEPGLKDRLLELYARLDAYPEVKDVLRNLRESGLTSAMLSNGSPQMLESAIQAADIEDCLDSVISVEEVGVFKPHKSVYELVEQRYGCLRSQVFFVSSNGWDAAAAAGFGFVSAWVNRAGEPVDRLPWRPLHIVDELSRVPQLIAAS